MDDQHGHCPHCGVSLTGGLIWDYFLDYAAGNEAEADRCAEMFGATREKGRWGRQIALYDQDADETTEYMCPDCKGLWPRK